MKYEDYDDDNYFKHEFIYDTNRNKKKTNNNNSTQTGYIQIFLFVVAMFLLIITW